MEENINTNKIYFFDTTLRDGQQTTGVDFSVEDKIKMANAKAISVAIGIPQPTKELGLFLLIK